jgi:glycosyltransferase involved in cell wall biosynthesis
MSILTNGFIAPTGAESLLRQTGQPLVANGHDQEVAAVSHCILDAETLRRRVWEIGETRAADMYCPPAGHVGLAPVAPCEGFAHWRILPEWVDQTARHKGDAWHNCRLVLRLYDVSFIVFTGLNAHRILDRDLPGLCGQLFFKLPRPGTWELAEVGFLLRNGEFVPVARSQTVPFPPDAAAPRSSQAALLVKDRGAVEEIGTVWDQERILRERRQPRLRRPLYCASFAWGARDLGHDGWLATFVSELAAGQCAQGHEAHVFVPASEQFDASREVAGVHYHPLPVPLDGTPLEQAQAFGSAAAHRLREFPPFDLIHQHEWMTAVDRWAGDRPTVLSLSSIEATRRNGALPGDLSVQIELAEREAAGAATTVLTPHWLREQALAELGIDGARLHGFPMEGRMPNEWEAPLDVGQVKMGIGLGPFDRMMLFIGPLEHAAGVDLLLEAVPVLLQRAPNLRVVFVGAGLLYGQLHHRAHQLGVAHAVRIPGHVEGPQVTRLVRAAEALVLPSRYRVPFDDGVVDLARRGGRPVVTTHGGPAHLVRHEETGIVTYDNPGSMVWAIDRMLGDPAHAERMGNNGRRRESSGVVWGDVARHYLELCAAQFPALTETAW